MADCLDANVVAAYVDGTLDRPARARVQAHLAGCDTCYELVAEILHTQEEPGEGTATADRAPLQGVVVPFARRRGVIAGVGSLAAAAAALLLVVQLQPDWWVRLRGGGPDPQIARLVEALGDERTVDGRLSGGFRYGPLRSPIRSGRLSDNLALLAAAGELQQAAQSDRTPENLHGWGVAQLLLGQYDGSIDALHAAQLARPRNPSYLADLGAAHLGRATSMDRRDDLAPGLDAVDKALVIAPALAEAWFTKARLLERLQRRADAIDAWNRYLQLDPASPWSEDARRHLKQLQSP